MNKKRIGVWIRVSTEDSAKGESPEHHKKRAELYAELQGYEIVEIYDLAGMSGETVMNYPETQRMLLDIKRGHISGLIFSKLARFARNTIELLEFANYFQKHNASLISLQERFDTSTPAGKLFYTIVAAMAEWEREEIVSRVNESVKVRAKIGKRLGGKDPYGYRWEGHDLVIHPEEAVVRKLAYTLFLQEKRKKTVARILNERGYRNRKGTKFFDTNIKRWLRDPLSKGLRRSYFSYKEVVDGKTVVKYRDENEWEFHPAPAIVTEELWQQVNDILDEQEAKNKKPLNRKTHTFTRYIYCGCGSRMNVRSGNVHYRCSKTGCGNKIERKILDQIYKEQLMGYVESKEKVAEYLKLSHSTIEDKKDLLKLSKDKQTDLEKRIQKIIDLHVNNNITEEAFNDYYDEPYNQLQEVKKEILKLQTEIEILDGKTSSIDLVMKEAYDLYTNWDKLGDIEKRRIVEMVTDRITIGTDDSIHIKLYRLMPEPSFSEFGTNGQQNPFP
ncbi:serine recombinase [Dokdonia pacifica]|uniref:Site-specific DNA recombinase n=1 Tax=Dokdonia pacifica TaxID=1627892 RepID=A0A239DZI0_9FLAO|nr:recombinase family protein [Dokdonia pacifica]GGG24735.1 serine recombinase [Dokdonia pacifica]SNS37777.1 site-specific DNA recombinase [Dokdonia pacifica]